MLFNNKDEEIKVKKDVDSFIKDIKEIQKGFEKEMTENPKLKERLLKLEEEEENLK